MSLAHHYVKGRAEAGQRPSNATAERARKVMRLARVAQAASLRQ